MGWHQKGPPDPNAEGTPGVRHMGGIVREWGESAQQSGSPDPVGVGPGSIFFDPIAKIIPHSKNNSP